MAKIMVLYGTSEGQTAKIAHAVGDAGRRAGHDVHVVHGSSLGADFDVAHYDALVVGASVHEGRHQKYVLDWIRDHRRELEHVPSAFFQVSLSSADASEKSQDEARGYLGEMTRLTGWAPPRVGLFAGALLYTQYAWWKRFVMRKIQESGGGETDTSRDFEYTDWAEVDRWSSELFASLPREPASASASTT
jgi:menaquinone-dependent protoporphyrinogen oxidase